MESMIQSRGPPPPPPPPPPYGTGDIQRKANLNKKLWFCGHSLGAAMATIMASRCKHNVDLNDPMELYTHERERGGGGGGGGGKYCNSLHITHRDWGKQQ